MKIIANIIICVFAFPCIASSSMDNQPDHYCDDKESWLQWENIIVDNSQDDEIMSLYAFRIGLCSMVKSGQIETPRATKLFERMRSAVLEGREKNQTRLNNESGT